MKMFANFFQGRKLKCDHCKHKYSYTLDYANHVDTHHLAGLACRICQCEVVSPKEYGEHMEIHHPSVIFAKPAPEPQQEPQMEPAQLQQEMGMLPNETTMENTSNQDLIAASSMFNGSPEDLGVGNPSMVDPSGLDPSSVFGSNESSSNPLMGFTQNDSANLANPLTDQTDDYLSEEAVFESILNGENQTGITPSIPSQPPPAPPPVQNSFG